MLLCSWITANTAADGAIYDDIYIVQRIKSDYADFVMSSEWIRILQLGKYSMWYPPVEVEVEEDLHSIERIRCRVAWLALIFPNGAHSTMGEMRVISKSAIIAYAVSTSVEKYRVIALNYHCWLFLPN